MEARRKTNGAFTIVSEEEIKSGVKILAARGVYVEPTSAVVVKAFDKFVEEGVIRSRVRYGCLDTYGFRVEGDRQANESSWTLVGDGPRAVPKCWRTMAFNSANLREGAARG